MVHLAKISLVNYRKCSLLSACTCNCWAVLLLLPLSISWQSMKSLAWRVSFMVITSTSVSGDHLFWRYSPWDRRRTTPTTHLLSLFSKMLLSSAMFHESFHGCFGTSVGLSPVKLPAYLFHFLTKLLPSASQFSF